MTSKCSHKFVDSTRCLKCGWTPTKEDFDAIERAGYNQRARGDDDGVEYADPRDEMDDRLLKD